jgi:hypothetical protein
MVSIPAEAFVVAKIKNFGAPVKPARSRRCKSTTVKE